MHGKDEAVHGRIDDQFVADGVAGAGDQVEDARRQSGIAEHFVKAEAGQRRVTGRLENNGIARDQRAGGHASRQGEREVERPNHGPDAIGPEHAAGLLGAGAAQRQFVAVMFLDLPTIVEDQIDGFGDFGDGFEAVLANLEAEQGGQLELALRHQVGGFAQQSDAMFPAQIAPDGINSLGRRDGPARVVAAAALKFAEQHACVGWCGVGESA